MSLVRTRPSRQRIAGALFLALVVGGVTAVLWLSGRTLGAGVHFTVEMRRTGALRPKARIKLAGRDVGEVRGMVFESPAPRGGARAAPRVAALLRGRTLGRRAARQLRALRRHAVDPGRGVAGNRAGARRAARPAHRRRRSPARLRPARARRADHPHLPRHRGHRRAASRSPPGPRPADLRRRPPLLHPRRGGPGRRARRRAARSRTSGAGRRAGGGRRLR